EQYPVTYYSSVQDGMFRSLVEKYMNGPGHSKGHGDHQASATEPVAMCTSGDK
ncbi:cytochrome ubiquinol oxidase subunit II, partial [Xanthomonas vasicola]